MGVERTDQVAGGSVRETMRLTVLSAFSGRRTSTTLQPNLGKVLMAKSLFGCALLMVLPVVASAVLIDLVTVGDPGNSTNTGSVGSVGYNYEIGTFEVMNSQYVEFLNSVAATDTYGLYQPMMGFSAWGGITRSVRMAVTPIR